LVLLRDRKLSVSLLLFVRRFLHARAICLHQCIDVCARARPLTFVVSASMVFDPRAMFFLRRAETLLARCPTATVVNSITRQ
jgi:hypothetical protein